MRPKNGGEESCSFASVIEGLHGVHAFHAKFAESLRDGYELSDGYASELDDARAAGILEVRKGANIGLFIMSKRASIILVEFIEKYDKVSPSDEPPGDFHEFKVELTSRALIAMTNEAKKNLGT